ncbi:MAG TPA: SMP-30/gluconolactonase/LRE family protein [Bryobacteraceae bacterium]|nr:SMP-30/gluconolactonase/LRE family protein [Bryobacteraceae bacterium]
MFTLLLAQALFVATPFTPEHSFTSGVEGPATDKAGNVYAVSYQKTDTIGKVTPDGKAELWVTMPEGSLGNGIRFTPSGRMFVADYKGHNILEIDPATKKISVFAKVPTQSQPNDIALGPDGTLWASDPAWKEGTGQVWRIDTDAKVTSVATGMSTTNGIEVSPNGKYLYVNESGSRKVWRFRIGKDKMLSDKKLLIEFPDFGMDGMRADVKGNLYITRHGKGVVAIVSPKGKLLREVSVLGKSPTNITFGGPDGKTCYVTEVEHGRLVSFRVQHPGR